MRNGFIVLFSLIVFLVHDNQAKETWHEGVVILKNNKVLVGQITLNSGENIVRLKMNENQYSYTAFQVAGINFHDEELGAIRKYISLPYAETDGRFIDVFFEVIIKNEVSLLRKKFMYSSVDIAKVEYSGLTDYSSHRTAFEYYFEYKGFIIPSQRFRKDLKPLLEITMENEISSFIKENGLNMNRTYDQVLLIRFYNKLFKEREGTFLTSN